MLLPLAILASLTFEGNFTQGGLVKITAPAETEMTLDGEIVDEFFQDEKSDYYIGFGRDAKPESLLMVTFPDGKTEEHKLLVNQRQYEIQYINKVSDEIVKPNSANQKRIEKEALDIGVARMLAGYPCPERLEFEPAAPGLITGWYGSQRIYNGVPKSPHSGVDFKGDVGDPVYAPEAGKVVYYKNMFLGGNTMALDHGCGIVSTFLHLSSAEKKVGDVVKKGEIIARIGQTGLATGPHLHWSLNKGRTRLDPLLLIE